MAAIGLRTRQYELGNRNKFAPAVGKIPGEENAALTSAAKHSEIPPFVD
jgi:hypothetical protein